MITETSEKNEILDEVAVAISGMQDLMSGLGQDKVNTIPYEDSWTAGQLFRHVTKSIDGLAGALGKEAKPANRSITERIPELRKTFLDFSIKMKSPDFIKPEAGPFEKQTLVQGLNNSFEKLKANAANQELAELLEGLPLGPITKLELLHFVLYHTQRHLHQLNKISNSLMGN